MKLTDPRHPYALLGGMVLRSHGSFEDSDGHGDMEGGVRQANRRMLLGGWVLSGSDMNQIPDESPCGLNGLCQHDVDVTMTYTHPDFPGYVVDIWHRFSIEYDCFGFCGSADSSEGWCIQVQFYVDPKRLPPLVPEAIFGG